MIRTQVQLTEEQIRTLRMLASQRRVSVAELVRQSVDHFVHSLAGTDVETRKSAPLRLPDVSVPAAPTFPQSMISI